MERLRIAVFGYLIRGPLGGLAWHHLQYLKGLQDLGHEVVFFEDSEEYPSCYDPVSFLMTTDPAYGVSFLRDALGSLGMPQRWAYFDWHTTSWMGMTESEAVAILKSADLAINLSGINPLRPWATQIPVRVFVDTDPVFTQIQQGQNPAARTLAESHNRFLTFGEELIANPGAVPMGQFPWQATRQPVSLACWDPMPAPKNSPYTTVMQWESYPALEYKGQRYGMKADSFPVIERLPRRVSPKLQIALGGSSAPRQRLRRQGWSVVNSLRKSATPTDFQKYVANSRGELTVAKHGYVVSNSGWFSERSANYLASGRPVVTQDTGFSKVLPTGEGLLAFSTMDEAIGAIETVESHYERHCKAAREIAEEYFDARKVLSKLLDDVMTT